jgi:hypothetical protein
MKKETIIILSEDNENLKRVREKYGKTHKIEAVLGTTPLLTTLLKGQSVCTAI